MPLVKHDYPVLEYDTASKAVFQPGNGKKCFPAKAVFAFLGDEVENYAHTHDGIQIDEFESATRRYPIYECLYNSTVQGYRYPRCEPLRVWWIPQGR